jgi:hypothetical protein
MSKMGSWVLEMQEDALELSLKSFCERYGYTFAEVWHDINYGDDRDREPDFEAMEEGYHG